MRLVLAQTVVGHQLGQKSGIDAARDIVACRNRGKGPRIIVEAYGVVEACGFHRLLAEAFHPLDGIEEPPGRTQPQTRIVSG